MARGGEVIVAPFVRQNGAHGRTMDRTVYRRGSERPS